MENFLQQTGTIFETYSYLLLIPLTSGLIGWSTNILAIKMMFYPLQFVGMPPYLGWQGVIPANGGKMAGIAVDLMLEKLITIEEITERVEIDEAIVHMNHRMEVLVEEIIDDVMRQKIPTRWEILPLWVKEKLYNEARQIAPDLAEDVGQQLKENITEILDFKAMMIDTLTNDPKLLNSLFQTAGERSFKFLKNSGFYFGCLFGIPSIFAWQYFETWWILPLCGLIVGYATNELAIKMIFTPIRPKKIGPFKVQGLFVKDQPLVSKLYGKVVATNILNSERIFNALLERGASKHKLHAIVERNISRAIDSQAGFFKPPLLIAIGTTEYIEIKKNISDKIMEKIKDPVSHAYQYTDRVMDIEASLREKIAAMAPEDFEGLLHPAFEEDEIKLILVGGALGFAAGCIQFVFII